MAKKRQAVSIAITPDANSAHVYLVERNPELKFFGGFYAFPGGTIDQDDGGIEIDNGERYPRDSLAYLVAGAREIFEETGILLAHGGLETPSEKLERYRRDLLAEKISFAEILKQENKKIDAKDFHFIESFLTPEFAPVRYDTQFYWVELPAGQKPTIVPGELVSGDFYRADEVVRKWQNGEMFIVPPVIFMLRELANQDFKAMTEVIRGEAQEYQTGAIHQIYFTPGIQMLPLKTRTLPPATHTNAYLVGERELYLIDPAPDDNYEQERLWRFLDKRRSEGRQLKGILLTHHHGDHVGAVNACQAKYGLPVYAHEHTIARLAGIDFEAALSDGDQLDLGETPDGQSNWKLDVIYTPGHASGHLAFKESRYGAVIAGDMISTLSTIVVSPPDGHLATYMQSLQKLASLTDGTIYPSHGPAVKTGRKVVQYFIKHRQAREVKLLAALTDEPKSASQLVRVVYDDVNSGLWGLAEHSLQAGLNKLIEEGKCRKVAGGYILPQ